MMMPAITIETPPQMGAEPFAQPGAATSSAGGHAFGALLGTLGAAGGATAAQGSHGGPQTAASGKPAGGASTAKHSSGTKHGGATDTAAADAASTAAAALPQGIAVLAFGHPAAAVPQMIAAPSTSTGKGSPHGFTAAIGVPAAAPSPGATATLPSPKLGNAAAHSVAAADQQLLAAAKGAVTATPHPASPAGDATSPIAAATPQAAVPAAGAGTPAAATVPIAPTAFSLAPLAGAATTAAAPNATTAMAAGMAKQAANPTQPADPTRPQAAALQAQLAANAAQQGAAPAAAPVPAAAAKQAPPPSLAAVGPHGVVAVPSTPGTATAVAAPSQGTPLPPLAVGTDVTGKVVEALAGTPAAAQTGITQHAAAAGSKADSHPGAPAAGPDAAKAPQAGAADPAAAAAPHPTAPAASAAKPQSAPSSTSASTPDQPATAASTTSSAPGATPSAPLVAAQQGPAPATTAAPPSMVVPHPTVLSPAGEQLAFNLKRAAKDGDNQIQIELNPASLGKIEVRLDFSRDGHFSATISADRPDTLQLLHSDSQALQQSLRDAGLRADSSSLSFNLRGGDAGAGQQNFAQSSGYRAPTAAAVPKGAAPVSAAVAVAAARAARHHGNLDIHV